MASIAWSDTTGSATLVPNADAPDSPTGAAHRFRNWTPTSRPFGDAAHGLGTGIRYLFAFRTDHGVALEIPGIPRDQLDLALRLEEHLLNGGSVAVYTDDANDATYATCGLMPETAPELTLSDPPMIEYTLKLTLLNVAASPVAMVCEYA